MRTQPWSSSPVSLRAPQAEWTAERLTATAKDTFGESSVIVVSNRQPLRHQRRADGTVGARRSSGGLVTALEPLVQACSGVWVAHGDGSADRDVVDQHDGVLVPPADPSYRLRRVWLTTAEQHGYYDGFANEGLWALCHQTHVRAEFRQSDFRMYQRANVRFASAVAQEARGTHPLVLVQDYHLALAPRLIRRRLPGSVIVAFWHIPWPSAAVFDACPWRYQLLEGLVASDIVGFQTPADCTNFAATAERVLGARVTRSGGALEYCGRVTEIRAYPAAVPWPHPEAEAAPPVHACRDDIRRRFSLDAEVRIAVGVDRLDYSKGLPEKFLAVERMLEQQPELRQRFVLLQLAEPSRATLPAYQAIRELTLDTARRINDRFGRPGWTPIELLEAQHAAPDVFRFLRAADVCYVGSLMDGMNLVAKEFVAARDDERGVLVLSEFAGAIRQLTGALRVNPYVADDAASTLGEALRMAPEEQRRRMREMRAVIAAANSYWWAGRIVSDAARRRWGGASRAQGIPA